MSLLYVDSEDLLVLITVSLILYILISIICVLLSIHCALIGAMVSFSLMLYTYG